MWYNRLIEYFLEERFRNNPFCPCIYMKILENQFAIIIVYVNDINIDGTLDELTRQLIAPRKNLR